MTPPVPAPTIAVVDYGMGNRRSVEKALERVGVRARITGDHDELRTVDGLLVPGVGAFPAAMERLRALGLVTLLRDLVAGGTPLLGACLGMQLLFERSVEHGGAEGLGLLPGEVVALDPGPAHPQLKLPHIGWNEVRWERPSPISAGLPDPATFYHVHSYVPRPSAPDVTLGTSDYGVPFASVVGRDHVFGAQFHPEKSSTHGLAMLANFARLCAPSAQPNPPVPA
ncbi:imidazole glycerol phosphate synthase subunit HisH [Paraconexibacter algicola]|uniref:Imidazole glycerol phosphate synthase subunit HisH n=1 Tax=Paraconexibacter algicola TaxID=2133960 RepID=A0A2T4UBG0_9ACTN|nr:imidazole glycerol phosphate synthase subunit HisH [Paraconexibacter algicola]PTL54185.1 imidazole glycerol phosphate synthase subunit HisH [Paraconexibacter algicola]